MLDVRGRWWKRGSEPMLLFLIVGVIALIAYLLVCKLEKRKREEAAQVSQSRAADARFVRRRMAVPWI
jgi:hypothetical protein